MTFPDVATLSAQYRSGALTPVQVVETALALRTELEPHLNAFADPMTSSIRAQAQRASDDIQAGRSLGPLHGIPVAVKDLIEVAGTPTGYGSRVLPPKMATQDATLVTRLRAAGAIIFGKTNLLEYAYGIAHPDIGQTNNPHDVTRTAGGSSGGSAAAVAAGIVPLAIGTDTGGSIRIPAAYCGIVGVKPTFGLVPLDGVFPLSHSLDHAGPLARNTADAALLLQVLSGQAMDLPPTLPRRIGLITAHVSTTEIGQPVSDHVLAVTERLRAAGIQFVPITIPGLSQANAALVDILHPEASLIHQELLALNPQGYAPGTHAQIQAGFLTTATDYLRAKAFQTTLRTQVEHAFASVDLLISPAVPFVAPHEDPVIVDGEDSEMLASGFANVTGHPSLSLPCGHIGGLPVGLQLTGPFGQDARLFAQAQAIEAVLRQV